MNLVAKEFVAARDDERGVLVLSQFTGAARELTEALIVNPYDLEEASAALAAALSMSPDEQRERMRSMRAFVAEFNVYRWAGRMLVDAARAAPPRPPDAAGSPITWPPPGRPSEGHPGAGQPRGPRSSSRGRTCCWRSTTTARWRPSSATRTGPRCAMRRGGCSASSRRAIRASSSRGAPGRTSRRWLSGIALRQVIGNHGLEPWQATRPPDGTR